jgi:D-arabinose 1-dehydrogenase-like Zn-dependent alcohol dehydrogenase
MRIQAYAITKKGGQAEPFSYDRQVGHNDVVVKITHCGIAKGDVQSIDNDWGDTTYPLVPGHEIIGLIEDTGSSVAGLKNGDRVGVGYQQAACFQCHWCKTGEEQLCPTQKVIAVHCYGGLASHIVVDSRFAFQLPPRLDSAKSAPLLSSGLTVYSAIIRARLPDTSVVAVLGVGGLGHLAIQFLQKMGHKVFAFSHSHAKREMIARLGATYVDSSHLDSVTAHKRQFDLILSTLNVRFDLDAYLGLLKPQGRMCLVASPLKKLSLSAGLLYDFAQRTIYGNYIGSRADMMATLAFAARHKIKGSVDVMPFSQVNEAIEMVRGGTVAMRVVLEHP